MDWLIEGSEWVEVDERLHRCPNEMVLVKKYASCFFVALTILVIRNTFFIFLSGFLLFSYFMDYYDFRRHC